MTTDGELTLLADPAAPLAPWARSRLAGGRYKLVRRLGMGTSKQVFLAQDEHLEREVAVSFLTDTALRGALHTRLLREIRATAALGAHAHIVTVHDVRDEDGLTYVVTQLAPGGSVADRLRRAGPHGLPVSDAVRIARDVADALAHAHAHSVIHCDVKPGNILLTAEGGAVLADFGIARVADSQLTTEGAIVGTVLYMSPEQAQGRTVDPRSDLYALGATLFEMVCGRPPFLGDQAAVLQAVVGRPPPDPRGFNPDVPAWLAALILRLLDKQAEGRPHSAREVMAGLAPSLPAPLPARPRQALPGPLAAGAERPFVGRADAIERLRRCWRGATMGGPAIAVVTGEAGIGKTRLVGAFAREAQDEAALVLYGRCDEEPVASYQPFVEALRELLAERRGIEHELDQRLEPELHELSRIVPELRREGATAADRSEPQRYLLFEAVVELLAAAASTNPLVLVLDDLQWADKPTALLLGHLMRRLRRARPARAVMVVGTARDEALEPDRPISSVLSQAIRDQSGESARIPLTGLDEASTAALVGAGTGHPVHGEFATLLCRRTAGNPFFIRETLRGLREIDLADADRAAHELRTLEVPASVQEVIGRRLASLSAEAVALLRHGSACGREFRLDVVAEMLGTSPAAATEPLEEAIEAGLLVEPRAGRAEFCHALVRDTVYGQLGSKFKRARLHRAAGTALERLDGERAVVTELAYHFHAALAVGGAEQAFRYAVAAADQTAADLAYEEAASHCHRALDALDSLGPDREVESIDVLVALGRVQWQAGERDAAQVTFMRAAAAARRLEDPERLALAALGYEGRWYDAERLDPQLIALLEEALAALPGGDSVLRARLTGALAYAVQFEPSRERTERLSAEGVSMARRLGDRDALIAVLGARHNALLHVDHLRERLAISEEWLDLAQQDRPRSGTALALTWRIYDLFEVGSTEAARISHGHLVDLALELRQPLYRAFAASWDFNWLLMGGAFAEAEAKAKECFRFARRAQGTFAESLFAGQLFGLYREQDRLAELRPLIDPLVGERPKLAVWRAGLTVVHLAADDADRARAGLEELAADDFAGLPRDGFWMAGMCMLAEAAVALDDRPIASALQDQLRPHAARNAQVGLAFSLGPVRRFLGMLALALGDRETARRDFEAALEASAALGSLTTEARVERDLARLGAPV